jgi:hypothetical protein
MRKALLVLGAAVLVTGIVTVGVLLEALAYLEGER